MPPILRPLVVVALLAGCPGPEPPPADMAAAPGAYTLEAMSPVEIGLTYGEARPLRVRYADDHGVGIANGLVRYAIFGDPKGSALATDRVATPDDGVVGVNLTAGAAEAQFRVVVSAPNAADLEFAVSVSKFPFFEVDVQLAYDGEDAGGVARVEALLFGDRECAALSPDAPLPSPLRSRSVAGTSGVLDFPTLLGVSYAIVGRALGVKGNAIGFGCVDLALSEIGSNPKVVVPVPMTAVLLRVVGSWTLATRLQTVRQPSPVAVWQALAKCPRSPADQLLDAIIVRLGTDKLASAISGQRGPVDASGCRPDSVGGAASLDRQLHEALSYAGSPASSLPAVLADLDAITAGLDLTSTLTLTPVAGGQLQATHLLGQAALRGVQGSAKLDLQASAYPIVAQTGVQVRETGRTLSVAEHGFTLRLPSLWGRALGEVALVPRGLPGDARSLWPALLAGVKRTVGGQPVTGCAAVEDLLCKQTGATPCALQKACSEAIDQLGVQLRAPFIEPSGIDLVLVGSATVVDANNDQVADSLAGGTFMAQVLLSSTSGEALPVAATWSGQRAR